MNSLVKRLIAKERRMAEDRAHQNFAGFQVCEKLRGPLSTFAGVAGYHALLSRALVLAKAQAPLLDGVQIKPDGSLLFAPELEARLATDQTARAGEILANQLMDLLVTFIGDALTRRLAHDVWPEAANMDSKSKRKIS
jgi:hypothetical protein